MNCTKYDDKFHHDGDFCWLTEQLIGSGDCPCDKIKPKPEEYAAKVSTGAHGYALKLLKTALEEGRSGGWVEGSPLDLELIIFIDYCSRYKKKA